MAWLRSSSPWRFANACQRFSVFSLSRAGSNGVVGRVAAMIQHYLFGWLSS